MLSRTAPIRFSPKAYQALKPVEESSDKHKETWVQVRSGWHWVSVDLFLAAVLLIIISTTNIIIAKQELLLLLSIYYFVCGVVWLSTVVVSKNSNKQIMVLGQWIFCFIMSGLIIWGRG
ncbi:hypothetical protein PN36_08025 [Candidatus Thiomargarita nelsonii]|uniref:Uncharacterized protein n=1 Tax=Candidatus Thiomargarita nelsonii TaxID=1003181 RepID=A0A4E0QV80_9GAMM|nr:hypothetical protein PN36_08025 [Candidatus Thiomargarita nelsonii]